MLPARFLRRCCHEALLLLILVYSLLLLHRTWRTPAHEGLPGALETKTMESKSASYPPLRVVSKSPRKKMESYPDSLTELQRAERGVQQLQTRAGELWQSCKQTSVPLSPALQRAKEAEKLSERLALQFLTQHQNEVARRLVFLGERNLTWCLLPKVASTSWSRALQQLSGEDSGSQAPQIQLRLKHRPPSTRNLQSLVRNSESFLFIRHPFERLVTAYRSKLEDTSAQHDGDYFYGLYGRKMVAQYRKMDVVEAQRNLKQMEGQRIVDKFSNLDVAETQKNLKKGDRQDIGAKSRKLGAAETKRSLKRVEWRGNALIEVDASLGSLENRGVPEEGDTGNWDLVETNRIDLGSEKDKEMYLGEDKQFEKQFIDEAGGSLRRMVAAEHADVRRQPMTRDPTFEEFVDYLLDTDPYKYDEHWMPAAFYCDVCTLKYNFILKYEDFQMENEQFIRYLVAKGNLPRDFTLKWENKIGTDTAIVKRYLSLIPPDKLQGLIAKFEQDFRLFQYDPYSFL